MPLLLIGLVVVNAGVLGWFLSPPSPAMLRIDLDVYRLGAEMWLAGGDLYGRLPPTLIGNHLPFTYPPVSAVLFTPFTLLSHPAGSFVLTLLSIVVLAFVLVLVTRSVDLRPTPLLVGALLPAALLLEPVRVTLYFGQINVLLMGLVVADCLVRKPKWPRGAFVGLAAAVKLTPAAFVLFFLLRGDRRAALTAVMSFACVTAAGFVLNWRGSVRYWTTTLFDPDRIGKVSHESNQSIAGVLARLGIERGLLWLVLVCLVVAVGAIAVRRAASPMVALGLNAFVVLLGSPVSWSHHWVWVGPFLFAAWRTGAAVVPVAGGVALFLLSPHWWWEADDGTTVTSFVVGNAYVWCAMAVLACAAFRSADRQLGRAGVHVDHRAVP
ncbi:MAG: glycosyltransferase 87 family protein [Actinophytocola sp.]|uniref:glycosyltransferase 87 family protein n=1 Tax=Actinophytocola sp. TaxID=1872138 RepID=UPI003C720A2C